MQNSFNAGGLKRRTEFSSEAMILAVMNAIFAIA